jgi:glycerol-3-phosphate dehydrogenase (NAD(P)+)
MNIQILGAGGWGLAVARLLANNGNAVRLWRRGADKLASLRSTREEPRLLPGVLLPAGVEVSPETDPDADIAVFAVPSHAMRNTLMEHHFSQKTILVNLAKGIENDSLKRMSQLMRELTGSARIVAISGPNHAEEVGRDLPATAVAAGPWEEDRDAVQTAFTGRTFRVYTSPDLTGVELGGALKNIIAIAAGVSDGLGLGDNAKAALMTRGLAEISRLGVAMGADPLTFAGLSGMGDLIATCCSRHSRNRAVGEQIAAGKSLAQILADSVKVAEGIRTTRAALELGRRFNVDTPITEQVCHLLYDGSSPREAIATLMARDAKPERG